MGISKGQFIGVYNRVRGFIDDTKNAIYRQPAQTQQIDGAEKYITYGINDAFPLKIAKAIQDSPTASACQDVVCSFIKGSDFTDPSYAGKIVNSYGETFWEVHSKVCDTISTFKGFALCIKYNAQQKPVSVYHVPFQYCRLGKPDSSGIISKIKYNPFFGTGMERVGDSEEWDVFNPDPKVIANQQQAQKGKYKGQIFYWCKTTPLSPYYSYPVWASAMNWMMIESAIATFHKENLDNGFFQSVLLRIIGDPTAESTHPDDIEIDSEGTTKSVRTIGERFNLEMQKFSGAERVGNIMVQWGSTKDEWPDIQAFPTNGNQDLFTALSNEAINKITLSFKLPAVLANIQSGANLGGDGNVIRVSVKLMQSRVKDDQMVITQAYNKIFGPMGINDIQIVNYNPYPELEAIDKNIWDALTTEEKRQWIKENTNYPIISTATTPQPQGPTAFLEDARNALHTDYPEQAKKNAAIALQYRDKGCGGAAGWKRTEEIAKGSPIPYKEIKRIYNYLKKTSWAENKLIHENCDALLYSAWGGRPMQDWAAAKILSVENKSEDHEFN